MGALPVGAFHHPRRRLARFIWWLLLVILAFAPAVRAGSIPDAAWAAWFRWEKHQPNIAVPKPLTATEVRPDAPSAGK